MRVGILALLHESNTFISEPTTFEAFERDWLFTGEQVRKQIADTHHEVAGFFKGLEDYEQAITAVPLFAARTTPYGPITEEAFSQLVELLLTELKKAMPLDGLLVAPHGATVSEAFPDADGYWLTRVREVVGNDIPIIGTLDPHANLSADMVKSCNALIAYRSNPHLDQFKVGRDAALMMGNTLAGKITPMMTAALPPVAISIQKQETTAEPCLSLYKVANEQLSQPNVLSNSVMLGFPYADVEEMGSAFIVVTNNDDELGEDLVLELSDYLWEHREEFDGDLLSIDECLEQCRTLDGPICLLDMGDNVGGGSTADGTLLLHAIEDDPPGKSFICLYDPETVEQLKGLSPGDSAKITVGGKTDDLHGEPWTGDVKIIGFYDGKFTESKPRHGGMTHCDQGPTVVVETDHGTTIMITSRRQFPFSISQLTTFDIQPSDYHILVAKGVNAPIAAYQPVCNNMLRVNTPGVTTADMRHLHYENRRDPLYPLEDDFDPQRTTWLV